MLIAISALKGYTIDASDGGIGKVGDFLFDDATWKLRWIVVDVGTWLTDRKLLLHPSSILRSDHQREALLIRLTKAQIEASPPIFEHEPVSQQVETRLSQYYGSDPLWGDGIYGQNVLAPRLSMGSRFGAEHRSEQDGLTDIGGDPRLRSISEVDNYRIHATDGPIGHVEDFLVDDARWVIRFLIVDTGNWWPGKHVLVPHGEVRGIDYAACEIKLGVDCDGVRSIPPWDPIAMIDKVYDRQVPSRDGWRGVGF